MIDAVPGRDLRLTLDLDIQQAAEAALGNRNGALVALDPRTGDVLAMVSHPTYDPNGFAAHINRETWERMITDPGKPQMTQAAQAPLGNPNGALVAPYPPTGHVLPKVSHPPYDPHRFAAPHNPETWEPMITDPGKPLMNKAIQAQLAPGSIFKIFTATAALETGTISPDFVVFCPGEITIYGHTFHDWTFEKGHGHGRVDLHDAIVHSCDVYFYTLGKLLGIDKMAYFAKHM